MNKIFFILILSVIFSNCKAQKIKKNNPVFTQYCEKAMKDKNTLILDFGKIDSLRCSNLLFGSLDLKKCGIKLKNNKILRETDIHKPTGEKEYIFERTEKLFIYKDGKTMKVNLSFTHSDTFGHCTYIDAISFTEGEYYMSYTFPIRDPEGLKKNWFYESFPKDYFENEQEKVDFSNLEFEHIFFLKDKDEFTWKKIE